MNHVQKNEYITELEATILATNTKLTDYMVYLQSDKFKLPCNDYINSNEVFNFLLETRLNNTF